MGLRLWTPTFFCHHVFPRSAYMTGRPIRPAMIVNYSAETLRGPILCCQSHVTRTRNKLLEYSSNRKKSLRNSRTTHYYTDPGPSRYITKQRRPGLKRLGNFLTDGWTISYGGNSGAQKISSDPKFPPKWRG